MEPHKSHLEGHLRNARVRPILATALALTISAAGSVILPSAWSTPATAVTGRASRIGDAPARAAAVHVHVTVRKHRIKVSKSGFRPGNTVFDVRSRNGGSAGVQLVRFRSGYTFADFRHDLESDNLAAIRRIDRLAVFYGGMPVSPRGASRFGARLEAGRYLLFDFDNPRWVWLRVQGAPQRRSLPPTTGSVDMVLDHQDHRWQTPRRLPRSGWLRQTNRTDEPHFMDMSKVKRSTTRKQVRRYFAGKGPENPSWALQDYPGTFLVSPGRTVVWQYSYPPGKYLELCYWPSREDGMTHAEMGMWNFVTLH